MPAAAGGVFFILWFLMMIGMVVGYIVLLVAIWRGMRAHESIASALGDLLRTYRDSN